MIAPLIGGPRHGDMVALVGEEVYVSPMWEWFPLAEEMYCRREIVLFGRCLVVYVHNSMSEQELGDALWYWVARPRAVSAQLSQQEERSSNQSPPTRSFFGSIGRHRKP